MLGAVAREMVVSGRRGCGGKATALARGVVVRAAVTRGRSGQPGGVEGGEEEPQGPLGAPVTPAGRVKEPAGKRPLLKEPAGKRQGARGVAEIPRCSGTTCTCRGSPRVAEIPLLIGTPWRASLALRREFVAGAGEEERGRGEATLQ